MNPPFVSDFSLIPSHKNGQTGWYYKKATWPETSEANIHKLYNKEIPGPVVYNRVKLRDGTNETCQVCWHNDGKLYLEPGSGNGFTFLIRIDSTNNLKLEVVEPESESGDDTGVANTVTAPNIDANAVSGVGMIGATNDGVNIMLLIYQIL